MKEKTCKECGNTLVKVTAKIYRCNNCGEHYYLNNTPSERDNSQNGKPRNLFNATREVF